MDDEAFNVTFGRGEEIGWVFVSNAWTNARRLERHIGMMIGDLTSSELRAARIDGEDDMLRDHGYDPQRITGDVRSVTMNFLRDDCDCDVHSHDRRIAAQFGL